MTSQRWLTDDDFQADSSTKSIWWHNIVVIVPQKLRFFNNGSLYITGGGTTPPDKSDRDMLITTALACGTGTITSALFQVSKARGVTLLFSMFVLAHQSI